MRRLVETLFYEYPHEPELVGAHQVMKGIGRRCGVLMKDRRNPGMLAPLLVDDRVHTAAICRQEVKHFTMVTMGRDYDALPWFGQKISEAELEEKHGAVGCEVLDAIYHLEVIHPLAILVPDWEWVVVHPLSFKGQQLGMLAELCKRLLSPPRFDLAAMAMRFGERKQELQSRFRKQILDHFRHDWIGSDGRVQEITRPVWAGKGIVHEPVQDK